MTDTFGIVVSEGNGHRPKDDFASYVEATVRKKRTDALRLSRTQRRERYREIAALPTISIIRLLDMMLSDDVSDIGTYYYTFQLRRFAIRELRERARDKTW